MQTNFLTNNFLHSVIFMKISLWNEISIDLKNLLQAFDDLAANISNSFFLIKINYLQISLVKLLNVSMVIIKTFDSVVAYLFFSVIHFRIVWPHISCIISLDFSYFRVNSLKKRLFVLYFLKFRELSFLSVNRS